MGSSTCVGCACVLIGADTKDTKLARHFAVEIRELLNLIEHLRNLISPR